MKIDLVRSDEGDWTGLYLDNVLYHESHSLSDTDILDALNIPYEITYVNLDEVGRCPNTFEEALELEINE